MLKLPAFGNTRTVARHPSDTPYEPQPADPNDEHPNHPPHIAAHLQGTQSHRTKANLAKELQLPTHGKQSYNLTADHYLLHLQR